MNRKLEVPLPDGSILNIDIQTNLDSPDIQYAFDRMNYAHLLHASLKKLVAEMVPIALISQSDAYKEALDLIQILEPL